MSLTECRYSKYELRTGSLGFEQLGKLVLANSFWLQSLVWASSVVLQSGTDEVQGAMNEYT